jgi:hypothetical protein
MGNKYDEQLQELTRVSLLKCRYKIIEPVGGLNVNALFVSSTSWSCFANVPIVIEERF